ncbi:MAG: helix-turn-helix domain-containing protein [Actinomycetota bacterium]|nr:helix-turn-helix domain-containing protein [Actinomycetota bacterium]
MSVEAISWALNLAPTPADGTGRPSSACRVLVGLANHAGPDGTGAFPSVSTLMRYTGLSERTVRTCLDRLEAEGIISPCDPDIVAARIKRADRRPQGWDLNLAMVRRDHDVLAGDFAKAKPRAGQAPLLRRRRHAEERRQGGVQPVHPVTRVVDNSAIGVHRLHPDAGTGCNERADGVQSAQQRGAVVAPEPYLNHPPEPSAATGRACVGPPRDVPPGGGPVDYFFAGLRDVWQLTRHQRDRLAPTVEAALSRGWPPADLARFAGANVDGIRSPVAVLTARLSPAELPAPPGLRPYRRPWCGECDERTRMLGFDGDAPEF